MGDQTDGIVDNIDTAALGSKLLDLLRPVRLSIVDGIVSAERLRNVQLVLSASRCDNGRAVGFCDLDSGQANTTGCCMDENPITLTV